MVNRGRKWVNVERRFVHRRSPINGEVELMFFMGQFYHNLDDKGRLTVPALYRDRLNADGCILMQGFDSNLLLITTSHFEQLSQKVNRLSLTDSNARLLRRVIFSTAQQLLLDKNGRILLPNFLRQHAGIENEAVVIGAGHYIEIWSPEKWSNQSQQIENIQEFADIFSELDLSIE